MTETKSPVTNWIPAIISAAVSIGLAASATAIQLRDQSANLRERAAELEAKVEGVRNRQDLHEGLDARREAIVNQHSILLAEIKSEARALESRLKIFEQWQERTQSNRFTDRDAERLQAAIEVRIDELRRRIIQLEQATFQRNLDGAIQGPR